MKPTDNAEKVLATMNCQFHDNALLFQVFPSFDWLEDFSIGPVSHSLAKSSDETPASPPLSRVDRVRRVDSAESTAVSRQSTKKSLVESATQ